MGGAPDAVGEPAPLETTTDVDVHEGPSETIAERRARVHAKAQEAIAAMQEPLE